MKDYYDIYYFLTNLKDDININLLKEAVNNTFTKRESFDYLKDYKQIIKSISNIERMEKQWQVYRNKYKYAKDVDFSKILNLLEEILNILDLEIVTV